jgi:hypothetical protein
MSGVKSIKMKNELSSRERKREREKERERERESFPSFGVFTKTGAIQCAFTAAAVGKHYSFLGPSFVVWVSKSTSPEG